MARPPRCHPNSVLTICGQVSRLSLVRQAEQRLQVLECSRELDGFPFQVHQTLLGALLDDFEDLAANDSELLAPGFHLDPVGKPGRKEVIDWFLIWFGNGSVGPAV